jgi:hypothetical protein
VRGAAALSLRRVLDAPWIVEAHEGRVGRLASAGRREKEVAIGRH